MIKRWRIKLIREETDADYLEAKKWNESLFHDSNRRTKYRDIINQNINK